MKRFLLLFSLLCVTLASSAALADRINLFPNDGGGDNFGFAGEMNGHPLSLFGGTPYSFFGTGGYAPGSTFGGGATLFLYPTTVWIGGVPMEFAFPQTDSTIFISTFTLPTDGQGFTQAVEISFGATGINFDTGQTIGVGGRASGKLSFSFNAETGLYYPRAFVQTTVPEPGTVGLIAAGITAILASRKHKSRLSRR